MPFYEYECENCKFYTELLQKVSDPPLKKCPSCGRSTMKKLVSAPVFRLKGGGWYETDFKGDKENKRNLAVDKEPDTASDAKPAKPASPDSKADAKPGAETKSSALKSADSGGGSSGSGSSSESASPKGAPASRSSSASKSRAKAPARPAAKSKAKPAAKRRGR